MLFKNIDVSQCHELGWSMSRKIFIENFEILDRDHALLLKELWFALGGEPLHEESEASHVVEAHTGACSEEESMENLSSQSQETFFEELEAEDKNSDEVMSSSKDDPALRETSC